MAGWIAEVLFMFSEKCVFVCLYACMYVCMHICLSFITHVSTPLWFVKAACMHSFAEYGDHEYAKKNQSQLYSQGH